MHSFKTGSTRLWLFMTVFLILMSCTSQKPSGTPVPNQTGQAGGYLLELGPNDPTRNSVLILAARGFNLPESKIIWLVNGSIDTGASTEQFSAARAARGDTVQAKAVLKDGEILSNSVTIMNTPPAVSEVRFMPDVFKPGDRLTVEAAGTDPDGDDVTFLYEWSLNGETAGSEKTMNKTFKRGDTIVAKITPYDGRDYGVPAVVQREIRNMPPVIAEHKEFSFDGSVYAYQVKASDPDGDRLEYSLESPTTGMTINPATGLMKWVVPPDFKGKKNVSFTVRDGQGGTASYGFEITIQ